MNVGIKRSIWAVSAVVGVLLLAWLAYAPPIKPIKPIKPRAQRPHVVNSMARITITFTNRPDLAQSDGTSNTSAVPYPADGTPRLLEIRQIPR